MRKWVFSCKKNHKRLVSQIFLNKNCFDNSYINTETTRNQL